MFHFSVSLKLFQWPAIQFVAAGLLAAGTVPFTSPGAQAQQGGDYARCASDLMAVGIDGDTAAAACALALRPTEVSSCVVGVTTFSSVEPEAALSACSRDRRPDEVATCVADIHQFLVVDDSQAVLDHCHRSLLPERYAECVMDLTATVGFTTEESLARCSAAGYRPENVAPTFIPME